MADYRKMARRAAQKYGLDPNIFERQIGQESSFNPNARSPAGAQGIAQIMPATARGWGVNPADPKASLNAAAKNMASYVSRYGSYENALRAYNAGPGAIQKSKGYSETNNYVQTILRGRDPGRLGSRTTGGGGDEDEDDGGTPGRTNTRSFTTSTPGVDNRVARAQLVQSFLEDKKADPIMFATQARALKDIAPTSETTTTTQRYPGTRGDTDDADASAGAGGLAATSAKRADIINQQRLPYKWGGGHAGQTEIRDPVPLDCSGAVAKVLGIDARHSSGFAKWGRPGDGGNKGVTVYANNEHVLMKINGKFFGTSKSNPGGGAGWIPAASVTPDYLAGFTARHSNR